MAPPASAAPRILIYVLRRDLRVGDNPVLHEAAKLYASSSSSSSSQHAPFTHMLPLYVFTPSQLEVSGFLSPSPYSSSSSSGADIGTGPRCPYPESRSQVGGFWRCGRHRAKFLAESVFDLKRGLEQKGSGLAVRVGTVGDVVRQVLDAYADADACGGGARGNRTSREPLQDDEEKKEEEKEGNEEGERRGEVVGVWMTADETTYEKREERDVKEIALSRGKEFRLFRDEKYLIDEYEHLPRQDVETLR